MLYKVKVWDGAVRVFHWTLVLAVGFMWLSAELGGNWMAWHLRCGLLILGLIVFRLLWGIWGSDTARFTHFVKGPAAIKAYLQGRLDETQTPGHNPLGALMVLALLAAVCVQVGTGLLAADENMFVYNGFLHGLVSENVSDLARKIHVSFFWFLLCLVIVHVTAIVWYRVVKKENLVRPMMTGKKELPKAVSLHFAPWPLLLTTIALAVVVVCVVRYLGG